MSEVPLHTKRLERENLATVDIHKDGHSPVHYGCEAFARQISRENPDQRGSMDFGQTLVDLSLALTLAFCTVVPRSQERPPRRTLHYAYA